VIEFCTIVRGTDALKKPTMVVELQSHRTMAHTPQNNNTPQNNLVDNYPKNNPGCTLMPYLLSIAIIFLILIGYPMPIIFTGWRCHMLINIFLSKRRELTGS
jgi:hypothetical protein